MEGNDVLRKGILLEKSMKNEQKKEMSLGIDEGKAIDWENEEVTLAQMTQLVPDLELQAIAAR